LLLVVQSVLLLGSEQSGSAAVAVVVAVAAVAQVLDFVVDMQNELSCSSNDQSSKGCDLCNRRN
jgi:mannose/fructose/N-acetylgalactosamine-specific phosphotransferase system component IIC